MMIGGHGHVTPRADGKKARCGGPRICSECAKELAALPDLVHRLKQTEGFVSFPVFDEEGNRDGSGFRMDVELFREAADEIERLRRELRAIEQLADPYGPSPGDLIRLLSRMAHKALAA